MGWGEKGLIVVVVAVVVGGVALVVLQDTGVIGGSTDASSSVAEESIDASPSIAPIVTTTTATPTTVEQTFSQAEIASQSAESAYISTLSNAGINYNRSTLIELGKTACESLTIATGQGLSKPVAKLGLAQQYASGGSITQKEAIAIVSAAAGTFCPQHKGGY